MAAQLQGEDVKVERARGGFGDLRVTVDGQEAYRGNRLLYPRPSRVVAAVQTWMETHH